MIRVTKQQLWEALVHERAWSYCQRRTGYMSGDMPTRKDYARSRREITAEFGSPKKGTVKRGK